MLRPKPYPWRPPLSNRLSSSKCWPWRVVRRHRPSLLRDSSLSGNGLLPARHASVLTLGIINNHSHLLSSFRKGFIYIFYNPIFTQGSIRNPRPPFHSPDTQSTQLAYHIVVKRRCVCRQRHLGRSERPVHRSGSGNHGFQEAPAILVDFFCSIHVVVLVDPPGECPIFINWAIIPLFFSSLIHYIYIYT